MRAVKRITIYVVHDKDGIIDDYIPFYLMELRPCVTHLVVVCNGLLTDEGRHKLSNYADDIYGTGEMAQHWYEIMLSNNISLPNINGFVVSDGHRKVEEFCGYKVLHLSEIPYNRDIGFILALNPENTSEVKKTLEEKGFRNIFQI